MKFKIGDRWIGDEHSTYFIADIAANHDGDLERAKKLIHLAAEAGAEAAKFQNFRAPQIVSDYGFKAMGSQVSHQSEWTKSVYEVYDAASVSFDWTPILKEECDRMAEKGKPILISTGASDLGDVVRTVRMVQAVNAEIVLFQCNTNYTASLENYNHLHLNVLQTYQAMFPNVP